MVYDASEAHLFRCVSAGWVGDQPILVPDSFSTLGVTTPKTKRGYLKQGSDHPLGTDVCHAAYKGVRLNCHFLDTSGNMVVLPPLDVTKETSDSYHKYSYGYWGDGYRVEFLQRRFRSWSEWNHGIYTATLDYQKQPIISTWVWNAYRTYKIRTISVHVAYDIYYTGWLTGQSADTIKKYPHKHFIEDYVYRVDQVLDPKTGIITTSGSCSDIQINGIWPNWDRYFFKMNEQSFFIEKVLIPKPDITSKWYQWYQGPKASAFISAVEGLPTMDSNSWANLIEIIGLLKALKHGKFSKALDVPKKWYSWWLQFRYRYTTTKSDVESLLALKKNLTSFHEAFSQYRRNVYGVFFDGDTGITWRCEVQAVNRAANQIDQIYHGCATLGFDLSIYNLWDLIPYSFVVDWIFPVGNVLERMASEEYLSTEYWDFESICYSASYTNCLGSDTHAMSATVYNRWYESLPPNLDQYYWFEEHSKDPSLKTGIFRLIDGLSLLVSGRK